MCVELGYLLVLPIITNGHKQPSPLRKVWLSRAQIHKNESLGQTNQVSQLELLVITEGKKNVEWILEERLGEHQFLSQDQLQQGGL